IILAGVTAFFSKGLNFGVDFAGGRNYQVRFDNPVNTIAVLDALTGPLVDAPVVKTFGGSNQVMITTKYLIDDPGIDTDEKVKSKVEEGLAQLLGNGHEIV